MKTNKYKKNTKRLSKEPHKKQDIYEKNTKRISKKPHKKQDITNSQKI